ncbi:hypothetical protein COLO4_19891 [Corchorus olitorius]|uniref:AB hydrolase-1 domain-containing protein n=1 Tax=Corchorus olitorius TaxID=93759 RepID=A0A1R3J332_9ROSI|nr:hypothetical protein COLO4_19891 [Corchorus olitorius]
MATQVVAPVEIDDGSPEDPPVRSPRVKLRDGRHLAYRERGVPKAKSNCNIIIVHGFGSSKEMIFQVPQELIEELGIYFLLYDRAGYGESDPNLKRLAGVAMVVPVINYQWPSFPNSLIREDYRRTIVKLAYWIAKYTPGLLHWWVTQKWFPSPSSMEDKPERLRDRSVYDTLRTDFLVCYGHWDFDPMELSNPLPQNESCVHIWQGYEDKIVPFELQRCISKKLPWIQYHEVPDGGHFLVHYNGLCEAILRSLLLGEEHHLYRPSADKTVP